MSDAAGLLVDPQRIVDAVKDIADLREIWRSKDGTYFWFGLKTRDIRTHQEFACKLRAVVAEAEARCPGTPARFRMAVCTDVGCKCCDDFGPYAVRVWSREAS